MFELKGQFCELRSLSTVMVTIALCHDCSTVVLGAPPVLPILLEPRTVQRDPVHFIFPAQKKGFRRITQERCDSARARGGALPVIMSIEKPTYRNYNL